jgi:hypothetical protein
LDQHSKSDFFEGATYKIDPACEFFSRLILAAMRQLELGREAIRYNGSTHTCIILHRRAIAAIEHSWQHH